MQICQQSAVTLFVATVPSPYSKGKFAPSEVCMLSSGCAITFKRSQPLAEHRTQSSLCLCLSPHLKPVGKGLYLHCSPFLYNP